MLILSIKFISEMIRFHKHDIFFFSVMKSYLSVQESIVIRSRDRSSDAKNRKKQTFEISTNRISSTFERVEMKMKIIHEKNVDSNVKRTIHRANSVFERNRRMTLFKEMTSFRASFKEVTSSRKVASSREQESRRREERATIRERATIKERATIRERTTIRERDSKT
jgi:UDP-3-O-[3-hydroxymyristoyl] glucosamine N-acyltransferase